MSNITIPAYTRPDFLSGQTVDAIFETMKETDIGNGKTISELLTTEQGGMFYDACYPSAIAKAAIITEQMDLIIQQCFPQYASGSFLDLHGATYGVGRNGATKATATVILTGTDGTVVTPGAGFSTAPNENSSQINFICTVGGTVAGGTLAIEVEAVVAGVSGNASANSIVNITSPIAGLTTANNPLPASGGADVESDDQYRQRILARTSAEPGAGSISDIKRWALEVDEVGHVVVIPNWNDGYGEGWGAVKVLVLNRDLEPASSSIVEDLQTILFPAESATVTLAITITGDTQFLTTHVFSTSGTTPDGIQFRPIADSAVLTAGTHNIECVAVEPGTRGNLAVAGTITNVYDAPATVSSLTNAADAVGGSATYDGLAPFGAIITAKSFDAVPLKYELRVSYDRNDVDIATIIDSWRAAIKEYYMDAKEDGTSGVVRYNKIAGLLTGLNGVRDYSSLKITDINTGTVYNGTDVTLDVDDYPVTYDIRVLWQIPFTVKDDTALTPIIGATIRLATDNSLVGTTDTNGQVTIELEDGEYDLIVAAAGYHSSIVQYNISGADITASDGEVYLAAVS